MKLIPYNDPNTEVLWTWKRLHEQTRELWPEADWLFVCPRCGYEGMTEYPDLWVCPVCNEMIMGRYDDNN